MDYVACPSHYRYDYIINWCNNLLNCRKKNPKWQTIISGGTFHLSEVAGGISEFHRRENFTVSHGCPAGTVFFSLPFSFFDFHQQWWSFVIYIFILIYFFTYSQATPISLNHFQQASSVWLLVIAPFRHHVGLCTTNRPGSDVCNSNKSFPYMFAFAAGGVFSASQVLAEELYKLCGESGGDGARFSRLCRNNSHTRRFCQFIFSKNLSTAFQNSAYNAPSVFMKDKKTFFVLELITRLTVTDQS